MLTSYGQAQTGLSYLKDAICNLLIIHGQSGLTNAQIGKALGIYRGHVGHEGHISRSVLDIMEEEGLVVQKEDKSWILKHYL